VGGGAQEAVAHRRTATVTTIDRLRVVVLLAALGGPAVTAQVQLPSAPPKQFGTSVSPSFDGWFANADGTVSFLVGYYNRNTDQEIDVPIGPNNRFEPGEVDRGQPTHFLTRRRYGMFVITVPKDYPKDQKIWWSLTVNGVTNRIPFYMHTDYNVSPFTSTEESPNGARNTPPRLRFDARGPAFQGPATTIAAAVARTVTAGVPMPLDFLVDDDALYSTGANAPLTGERPMVTLVVSKYRGPGDVTVTSPPKFETLKGGKALDPYSGRSSTSLTFSQPGDYLVHVTANDLSGNGGGGAVCCWTNAMLAVSVKGATTTKP
jgi:hypothetical protein